MPGPSLLPGNAAVPAASPTVDGAAQADIPVGPEGSATIAPQSAVALADQNPDLYNLAGITGPSYQADLCYASCVGINSGGYDYLGGDSGLFDAASASPLQIDNLGGNWGDINTGFLSSSTDAGSFSSGFGGFSLGSFGEYLGLASALLSIFSGGGTVQVPLPPESFTTYYNVSNTNVTITDPGVLNYSPTEQVYQNNTVNALKFLTCPQNPTTEPNPTDGFYFDANKANYIGGDSCLAELNNLTTTLYGLYTTIDVQSPSEWLVILMQSFNGGWVDNVSTLQVNNPGAMELQEIGYSPVVDGLLSNGFNTSSYIFQGVPSSAQHAVWSWTLQYADFSLAPKESATFQAGISLIEPGIDMKTLNPEVCFYSGGYYEKTTLDSVSNLNIPFTEVLGKKNATTQSYSISNTTTFQTPAFPSIYDNFAIYLRNSGPSTNPDLTNMYEDVFSPWNYYTPGNSIDPFPIDLPSLFIANLNGNLATLPETGIAINPNAPPESVPVYQYANGTGKFFVNVTYNSSTSAPKGVSTKQPFAMGGVSATPSVVSQGETSTLIDSGASGGVPPYSYLWAVKAPGAANFTTISGATSTTYNFQTNSSTAMGTWMFELLAGDSNTTTIHILNSTVSVTVGSNGGTQIKNIVSVAGTADNYLYALYGNKSSYNIAIIRVYPHGYFMPTNIQLPPQNITCGKGSGCQSTWNNQWDSYWSQVISEQNNSAYVVGVIPLSVVPSFQAYNITADNNGDVFVVGSDTAATNQSLVVEVANVTTPGGTLCVLAPFCNVVSWNM